MDIALLLLRLLLGLLLMFHAAQKGLGWLRGPGAERSARVFESLGQRPGAAKVRLAVACESVSGLLLLIGLLTPAATAIAGGTMLVAGGSMWMKAGTAWNALGGGEYPLVLAGIAFCLGFSGAGAYSADAVVLGHIPVYAGLIVVVVAIAAAAPPLLAGRKALASSSG